MMKQRKGMSLVEILLAFALLGILIVMVSGAVTSTYQTAAKLQTLPGLYYGAQEKVENTLSELEDTITRKYRLENTLRTQIPPDADMQAELDELDSRLEDTCEVQKHRLFGKEITLYQVILTAEKENSGTVTLYAGAAGGERLERPVPLIDSVSANEIGKAVSNVLYFSNRKVISTNVTYAETNKEYRYGELYQWYVSVGSAHTVPFSDGSAGDESLHGTLIPVYPENFTLIPGEKAATVTVKPEYRGKFLICQVTPLSMNGKMGTSVLSNPIYISALPENPDYRAVLDASLQVLDKDGPDPVSLSILNSTPAATGAFTGTVGCPTLGFSGTSVSSAASALSRWFHFPADGNMESAFSAEKGDTVFAVVRNRVDSSAIFLHVGTAGYGFEMADQIYPTDYEGWNLAVFTVSQEGAKYRLGSAETDIAELIIVKKPGPAKTEELITYLKQKYEFPDTLPTGP